MCRKFNIGPQSNGAHAWAKGALGDMLRTTKHDAHLLPARELGLAVGESTFGRLRRGAEDKRGRRSECAYASVVPASNASQEESESRSLVSSESLVNASSLQSAASDAACSGTRGASPPLNAGGAEAPPPTSSRRCRNQNKSMPSDPREVWQLCAYW